MTSWPYCATQARRREDPLPGTAAPARSWLLVEYSGPWAVRALESRGLAGNVGRELHEAAMAVGGRVLLIRRPGRRPAGRRAQAWVVADQSGTQEWGTWSTPADLLAAAAAMRRGPDPGTAQPTDPLLLVCTHGLHDVCCAVRGRPVAAALAARWPHSTWECSHVGGDRFAANLLVVPDGTCYGRLDADSALTVVERHLAGVLSPDHLRGVCAEPPVVQAAIVAAARSLGTVAPGALRGQRTERTGPDTWQVTLLGRAPLPSSLLVAVTRTRHPEAVLTCRAEGASAAYGSTAVIPPSRPPARS